jgi:hypothetical protein
MAFQDGADRLQVQRCGLWVRQASAAGVSRNVSRDGGLGAKQQVERGALGVIQHHGVGADAPEADRVRGGDRRGLG